MKKLTCLLLALLPLACAPKHEDKDAEKRAWSTQKIEELKIIKTRLAENSRNAPPLTKEEIKEQLERVKKIRDNFITLKKGMNDNQEIERINKLISVCDRTIQQKEKSSQ